MLREISEKEFWRIYPSGYTKNWSNQLIYLDNGQIIDVTTWDGEVYVVDGRKCKPIYKQNKADREIIGYNFVHKSKED